MNTTAESGPGDPDGVQSDAFERAPNISPEVPLASDNTAAPAVTATTAPDLMESPQRTLGQRLRAGREAKGWSAEETGSRLRLPLQIIQRIEAEQFEKIGYDIYLRGYLTSYARLVGVPTVLVDSMLRDRSQAPPPLVSSGTISHSRYLYQRYSVSALYLILTAVIIVPAVMLAMRASMEPDGSQLAVLNPPANSAIGGTTDAASTSPTAEAATQPAANGGSTNAAAAPKEPDAPLVASLAPFPPLSHKDSATRDTTPIGAGVHTLKLTLKEPSWVEVISATGEKLEYGLLPAGSVRNYSGDKALEVRLGNCSGAEVETDGQIQDLTPYRRSNVARFKVFTAGEPISHTDS